MPRIIFVYFSFTKTRNPVCLLAAINVLFVLKHAKGSNVFVFKTLTKQDKNMFTISENAKKVPKVRSIKNETMNNRKTIPL